MSSAKLSAPQAGSLLLPAAGAHHVHFYRGDGELIEEITRLVGTALVGGDAAVVVATPAHREALARQLAARDLNLSRIAAQGRYVALDAGEILAKFMSGRVPDSLRFNDVIGSVISQARSKALSDSHGVMVFGEMVALLWAEGNYEAAIRLEGLWNDLADRHDFTLRCAYPISSFDQHHHNGLFTRVCDAHSAVLPVGGSGLLLSDNQRLRAISRLQQQVEVLEHEKALRASEQRFQLLVEAVQDYAIFMLDPGGYITTWNLGAERIKGYKASEIIGRHFSQFYSAEDIAARKPRHELEIAERDGRVEDEGWRIRKDGSRFWANVIITALKDTDGRLLGFAKVTRDFTERLKVQRELEDSNRRVQISEGSLRTLSLHLLRTQDEERRRIGRDLHDSLGQYLSVLKMKLDSVNGEVAANQPLDAAALRQCAQIADDAVKEVRTLAYLLYPPMLEEMGLRSAIPWYLDGFSKRSGLQTSFQISDNFGRFPADVELALFRVLQESLTNVHRHSGSRTANVCLSVCDREIVLQVSDRGKGAQFGHFEEGSRDWMGTLGVGMRGMHERICQIGGKLEISSDEGGTTVKAVVPVPDGYADERESTRGGAKGGAS